MADNVRYAFDGRVDIEPEQAWEIYRDLPEPTARECARILQQRGFKVSYDTIARWARRGEWRKRVEQLRAVSGVGSPKDIAAALKIEAAALTPELLRGLQLRLALRMAEQLNQLALDRPENFGKLVDVFDKMDAIIHRHRGEQIAGKTDGGERRSPIDLDEFKVWRQEQKGSDPTSA